MGQAHDTTLAIVEALRRKISVVVQMALCIIGCSHWTKELAYSVTVTVLNPVATLVCVATVLGTVTTGIAR